MRWLASLMGFRYATRMTIRELLKTWTPLFQQHLRPLDLSTAHLEIELLLAHILKKDRSWVAVHDETPLTSRQNGLFEGFARRRLKQEPMAYILGHKAFYGREFLTDARALIPRPETELLVERAILHLKKQASSTLVIDVGTGSGAIAATIALEVPSATVIASDVDKKALALARKNIKRLRANVQLQQANLLDKSLLKQLGRSRAKQLVIVANLPYLPLSDRTILAKSVTKYEPIQALFTKDHGLFLLRALIEQLATFQECDQRPLVLLAEFDPPQAETLCRIAAQYFPQAFVTIYQDLCGRDRVLEIVKKQ
ncbi:MAG: peptide chain release factor N(5)-glutamine methyltransferase [Patescibacteria group bacterium]